MPRLILSRSRADCGGVRSLKFFDLPREIRDLIYEHAVTPSDGLCVPLNDCEPTEECIWNDELWEHFCGRKLGVIKHNGLELQPAVTRACQQMRREALPIFYKLNDFAVCLAYSRYLHDTPGIKFLLSWLKAIGTKNTSNLRRLTIHYTREADKQAILDMKTILEEHTEFILIKRVR